MEKGNSSFDTFFHRRDGKIPMVVSPRNGAYGFTRVNRTVRELTAETSTPDQSAYFVLFNAGSCAFCMVNTTSSAVMRVPSENFTFLRRVNVYVLPLSDRL